MVRGRAPQPAPKTQSKKAAKDNSAASPALSQGATTSATTANRGSSKSTARARHNVPSCNSCGTVITEETKALQCDKCQAKESWKCADCLNLSGNVYEVLVSENGPPLRWFCDECNKGWKKSGIANLMSTMSLMLDKLDHLQDKVEHIQNKLSVVECWMTHVG